MGSNEREQDGRDWIGNSQAPEDATNLEPSEVTGEAQVDPKPEGAGLQEGTLTQSDGGLYGDGDTRKDQGR